MFVAVSMVALLGIAAYAVDTAQLYSERAKLQNAADAAALAAVEEIPDEFAIESTAQFYATLNHPDMGQIISTADVAVGHWDKDAREFSPGASPSNAVQVTARRSEANGNPVSLFFAPVFGILTSDVSAQAVAVKSYTGTGTRFLIDDEMFDTDIPEIENLAAAYGTTSAALLSDSDGDWFIDMPPGEVLELPTGQIGDEALFAIDHPEWPFSAGSDPSHTDFLNYNDDSNSWRYDLVPSSMLDPLLGVSTVSDPDEYWKFVNPNYIHVSPVYKSDVSSLNLVGGVPAVNALGERRGLVAFRILNVGDDPDGGGSKLPNLIIEIVSPSEVELNAVPPFSGGSTAYELVG